MSLLARILLLSTASTLFGCGSSVQDDKIAETVNVEVKKMIEATFEGNYEVVIEMTHPKLFEKLGGKEKAGEMIKTTMEMIKGKGLTFKVVEIGKPTVVKGDKDFFAVAPYTGEITGQGKKITMKTAVVGVSTDAGKTWKFINVDENGENGIRPILPDLPRELKIPRQTITREDLD